MCRCPSKLTQSYRGRFGSLPQRPRRTFWGRSAADALYRASEMNQMLFVHSEAELIRAAREGDGSAFAELLRPQYQAAFRVAYGLLHDIDEAEDAVQEA